MRPSRVHGDKMEKADSKEIIQRNFKEYLRKSTSRSPMDRRLNPDAQPPQQRTDTPRTSCRRANEGDLIIDAVREQASKGGTPVVDEFLRGVKKSTPEALVTQRQFALDPRPGDHRAFTPGVNVSSRLSDLLTAQQQQRQPATD